MLWASVQLRYELIRISEILQSWSKFKKSAYLVRINEIRQILLTTKPDITDLLIYKDEFIQTILNSGDITLISDLKNFIDNYSFEMKQGEVEESSY